METSDFEIKVYNKIKTSKLAHKIHFALGDLPIRKFRIKLVESKHFKITFLGVLTKEQFETIIKKCVNNLEILEV